MNKAICIENEKTLAEFIDLVDGFHDALLHELVMLHPGYVTHKGYMFGDTDLPNAYLIFQSQFSDILAVRVEMKGISSFRFDPKLDFRLEGEIQGKEIVLYPSGKEVSTRSEIRAQGVQYTMLGKEFRGSEYRLTHLE